MPTPSKKSQDLAAQRLLKRLCAALDDKKAEDLVVLDVRHQSSITNFLVIATGTSEPHLRALRGELDHVVKESSTRLLGIEAGSGSGWTVLDAFDVMVHVLTRENRARYRLENLWGDAPKLDIEGLLAPESAVPEKKPAPKRKRAPKKKPAIKKKAAARKGTVRKAAAKKAQNL